MTSSIRTQEEERSTHINVADYSLKSVTIFKSAKAEIVRTFSLNLQAGQTKVEISGLSSNINTDSVRVSGLGDARLYDVVVSINDLRKTRAVKSEDDLTIASLRTKKASLESSKAVRQREAELLYAYAKTIEGQHINPKDMLGFLESFVEKSNRTQQAIEDLDSEITAMDAKIDELSGKKISKVGSAQGQVTVVVGLDFEDTVDLKLTYIVNNVSWTPVYELHATTEKGKPSSTVTLHYRARVIQSTGEDWSQTSLTLSTVDSDSSSKAIPALFPVKIRPEMVNHNKYNGMNPQPPSSWQQPVQMHMMSQSQQAQTTQLIQRMRSVPMQQQQQQQQQSPWNSQLGATQSEFAAPVNPVYEGEDEEEEDAMASVLDKLETPAIVEPPTVVTETPVAISYSVHGKSSIPSDGKGHQVSIAILPFDANISYITIPRIEPRVYLQCEVKNTSEYRLLAGPVTVIFDDSYVSKSSINHVNTGDVFKCTLGDDNSTKVTYARTSTIVKSAGGAFVEAVNTTTYTTTISVHNKHQFPISNLTVRDVIPTSDDKRIKVILRKPQGLARAKGSQKIDLGKEDETKKDLLVGWEKTDDGKGGDKEGKFEWNWKVDSGAKVLLEAQWEIHAPADVNFSEVVAR